MVRPAKTRSAPSRLVGSLSKTRGKCQAQRVTAVTQAAVGLQGPCQPAWLTRAADFVAQLFGCLALHFARIICSIRCLQVKAPGAQAAQPHRGQSAKCSHLPQLRWAGAADTRRGDRLVVIDMDSVPDIAAQRDSVLWTTGGALPPKPWQHLRQATASCQCGLQTARQQAEQQCPAFPLLAGRHTERVVRLPCGRLGGAGARTIYDSATHGARCLVQKVVRR